MFGIYFSYNHDSKKHLIEKFKTKKEALKAKENYVVDKNEMVNVNPI